MNEPTLKKYLKVYKKQLCFFFTETIVLVQALKNKKLC